jgi:hypothetical protein
MWGNMLEVRVFGGVVALLAAPAELAKAEDKRVQSDIAVI